METIDKYNDDVKQTEHKKRIDDAHRHLAALALWDNESPNIIRSSE